MFKLLTRFIILILIAVAGITVNAAEVDTILVFSKSMNREIKCVVITPDKKASKAFYPVTYLLHGYSGNYSNWITLVPELKKYSDEFGMMIVCPDGHYSSWYFDSPIDSTMRYETFVAREVPAYIDTHYPTIARREARAITGLSMGGHGGLFLGFRHADVFGACGSMSGGVDLNSSRNRYDIVKRIGDTTTHAANWKNYSVMYVVEKYPQDSLAILIDCGTEDFFYPSNVALHQKMMNLKIPHEYIERPGKHNWAYWRNAVRYQLFYFRNFFER